MYIENNITKKNISNWLIFMFVLVALMIVIGGLTRLTDSGLSITKWELFSGILPPFNDQQWIEYFEQYKLIPEYKLQNYTMTMNEFKVIFWWEWAHRFLGRLIGICFFIPLFFFSLKVGIKKLISLYFIFFLISLQGFIGWYMVVSGLVDRVDVSHYRLSLHLVVAFVILSLIFWNYLKLNSIRISKYQVNPSIPFLFVLLIFLQIIVGAFVSGMDAGKIYNSWPLMGNSYFPDDNSINNLFEVAALSDPSLVQFIHRNLAYLIGIFYILIFYKIYRYKMYDLYKSINYLGIFIILQIILGIFTILYGAQIYVASMHQISSIFLVSSSIYFLYLNTKN
jgi:cytochrome c oxidase assembly protein subunit 15